MYISWFCSGIYLRILAFVWSTERIQFSWISNTLWNCYLATLLALDVLLPNAPVYLCESKNNDLCDENEEVKYLKQKAPVSCLLKSKHPKWFSHRCSIGMGGRWILIYSMGVPNLQYLARINSKRLLSDGSEITIAISIGRRNTAGLLPLCESIRKFMRRPCVKDLHLHSAMQAWALVPYRYHTSLFAKKKGLDLVTGDAVTWWNGDILLKKWFSWQKNVTNWWHFGGDKKGDNFGVTFYLRNSLTYYLPKRRRAMILDVMWQQQQQQQIPTT